MRNLFKIAIRNLMRYKRRTLLTASLISIGVIFVLTFTAVTTSFKNMMIGEITDSMLGHVQVHKKGYVASIDNLPLNLNLKAEQITQLVAGPVTLARAQGQWKLVPPAQGIVDVDAVNAMVALFARLQADSFGRPKTELESAVGVATTIRVTIGDATHWLTVATNGQASASSVELPFQLPASAVTTLLKPLLTTKP